MRSHLIVSQESCRSADLDATYLPDALKTWKSKSGVYTLDYLVSNVDGFVNQFKEWYLRLQDRGLRWPPKKPNDVRAVMGLCCGSKRGLILLLLGFGWWGKHSQGINTKLYDIFLGAIRDFRMALDVLIKAAKEVRAAGPSKKRTRAKPPSPRPVLLASPAKKQRTR